MPLWELALGKGAMIYAPAKAVSAIKAVGVFGASSSSALASHADFLSGPSIQSLGHLTTTGIGGALAMRECGMDLMVLGHTVSVAAGSAIGSVASTVTGLKLASVIPAMALRSNLINPVMATAGAYGLMRHTGWFEGYGGEDDEDPDRVARHNGGLMRLLPHGLMMSACRDVFIGTIVIQSLGTPIPIFLRSWAVGGILLSFPASYLVSTVVSKSSLRWGFSLEIALLPISYGWLTWGTVMLSNYPELAQTLPLLWWTSYIECITMWCVMTSIITGMVFITVCTLLLNNMKNSQN